MRQALELSITTAPVAPIFGDHSFETFAARAHQHEIDAGEIEGLEVFALQRLVAVADFDADRAARGERDHFVSRKQPLFQNGQHFPAHISRGADDGYAQTHESISRGPASRSHRN